MHSRKSAKSIERKVLIVTISTYFHRHCLLGCTLFIYSLIVPIPIISFYISTSPTGLLTYL